MTRCPCGSETDYNKCCSPFIDGNTLPETPEKLMRSRYTAYTQANMDYIEKTMQGPACDKFDAAEARNFAERAEWKKLEIVAADWDSNKGFVEFLAHFTMNNQRHVIHERSEFHFLDDRWYYFDGIAPEKPRTVKVQQIGRNEPCLCGSGKKYKKCCGVTS